MSPLIGKSENAIIGPSVRDIKKRADTTSKRTV